MIPGYSACLFVPIEKDFLTSSCLLLPRISELTATTVDGGSPAPVEVGSLSHHLQGFCTIPGGEPDFWTINSTYTLDVVFCCRMCVFFLHQVARRTTLHQPSCGSGLGFLEYSLIWDHHNSMNGEEAIDWKVYNIYIHNTLLTYTSYTSQRYAEFVCKI